MPYAQAPIAIVEGHIKVFVNRPEVLEDVLVALARTPDSCGGRSEVPSLGVACSRLLDVAAAELPHLELRGLLDLTWALRSHLEPSSLKRLMDLSVA